VDNTVDTHTGTIRLKGRFDNPAKRLWPGQFVNVILTLDRLRNVVAVPSQAVQTGASGIYVFVITPQNTVRIQPVTPGISHDGETVIESGVAAGDTVVTDGHLRLTPGAPVAIVDGLSPGSQPVSGQGREAGA
jgi:multidrug efflux system membrane fusion protein